MEILDVRSSGLARHMAYSPSTAPGVACGDIHLRARILIALPGHRTGLSDIGGLAA
jgi:hypothetical protein